MPSLLVGCGWVKVASRTEEEPRKTDESEGDEDSPCPAIEGSPFRVKHSQPSTYGNKCCEAKEDSPQWCRLVDGQHPETKRYGCRKEGTMPGIRVTPELIDNHSQSIQTAPNQEVQACTMPESTQEHRYHAVQVGINLFASVRTAPSSQYNGESQQEGSYRYPNVSAQYKSRKGEGRNPEICAESDVSIATKWNVKVVLQPTAKADVPPLPEVGAVLGLIR